MDLTTQQKRFDDIKWYDSIVAGCDRCGSYDFCAVCDKAQPNPCARAAEVYARQNGWVRIATVRIKIGK